jgi:hypothetical protein
LSRATALYPEGDRRGRRLLPDLAHALSQLGEFDRASEVLGRAKLVQDPGTSVMSGMYI